MRRSDQIFTDYMKDIEQYFRSRFGNKYYGIPDHEFQELSAYIASRAIIMVNDIQLASYQVSKDEIVRRHKDMTKLRKELFNNGNSEEV